MMTVPGQDINTNVVLTSDASGYSAAMRQAAAETQETQTAVDRLVRSIDSIKSRTQTGLKIFAAADAVALVAATKAAADFSEQLGSMRANADLTNTSFDATARSITNLRRELPMTTREVVSMVEMMQKMSVSGKDIQGSVETFKRLAAATNEDMYSLADGVINLNRQMGLPQNAINSTSDSLATLSAQMGVSATRVLGFAENIAPVARTVGMTSKEVLGFSSAFVKSGQDGFLAANVMTNMMMNIARATRYGSADLAMYASAANMTVEGFKELSSSDQFLKIVQEINRSGPDAIRLLDRMGIDGARSARAIQAVSQSGELNKAMGIAGGDHAGAVQSASEKAMTGLNESVVKLNSSLRMLSETFGGPLATGASKVVDLLTSMVQIADKAIAPFSAIAGPIAAIAGAGATALSVAAPAIGPLMTGAMALSLWRGPGRAAFQYARAGGNLDNVGLRRGAESMLAGRGGRLQNAMWRAGLFLGGGAPDRMGVDGRVPVGPDGKPLPRAYRGAFGAGTFYSRSGGMARTPAEAAFVNSMVRGDGSMAERAAWRSGMIMAGGAPNFSRTDFGAPKGDHLKWMRENRDLTKELSKNNENARYARQQALRAGTPRGGMAARIAFATLGSGAATANFFRAGFEGATLGQKDFTDRASQNRPRGTPIQPLTTAATGITSDGRTATVGGAMRVFATSVGRFAGDAVKTGATLAGAAAGGVKTAAEKSYGMSPHRSGLIVPAALAKEVPPVAPTDHFKNERGSVRFGRGLNAIGLNPAFLGIMGAIAGGSWIYNQHKESRALLEEQGMGEVDTALNKYAESLGIAGEAAVSFAARLKDADWDGGDPRTVTEAERQKVIAYGEKPVVDFSGMSREQTVAQLRTTFAVPGVDPKAQLQAKKDLLLEYSVEEVQKIIDEASSANPAEDMLALRDISSYRMGRSSSRKGQEQFLSIVDPVRQQLGHIALAYGERSQEYGDATAAVAVEGARQLIEAANDDGILAQGVGPDNLEKFLGQVLGLDGEEATKFRRAIYSPMATGLLVGSGSSISDEEVLEVIVDALRGLGDDELADFLSTADVNAGSMAVIERMTLQQEALREGPLGYLWTGENEDLLHAVTFGDKMHTLSARREAAVESIEQILAAEGGNISAALTAVGSNMGYEENDPAYHFYAEIMQEGNRRLGWKMGQVDAPTRRALILEEYEQAKAAYEAEPENEINLQRLHTTEDSVAGMRSEQFSRLLGWKRSLEDLAFQRQQSGYIRERDMGWQEEDYLRQRGYSFEDFGVSRARALEDFARNRARSEEDFNLQRQWGVDDYYLSLDRGEHDYQLSRSRAEYDFQLSREYALYDYSKARLRQEEDFNHQQELMARQSARNLTDIYSRMQVQRTWDAQNLLVNSQEQIEKMGQHRQGLEQLRSMGLSSDAIKLLGLTEFSQADQVAQLVSDCLNDSSLAGRFNAQIEERLGFGMAALTDVDNESYAEQLRQYELSRQRQEEDFQLSLGRQDTQFELSMRRQEEDYARALERGNEDFKKSMDRNDYNYQKSMERQSEDFARAMARQGDDFAKSMARNEAQWKLSLERNNKVWDDQLTMAQESLNHSFRETTGTFEELATVAMATMSGTTQAQLSAMTKDLGLQKSEIIKVAEQIATELPSYLEPLFGTKENMHRALSGTYFGSVLDTIMGKGGGGGRGRSGMQMGGPDNRKTTADLDSYDAVLQSQKISGPASVGVSGNSSHPLAGQKFWISSPYGVGRDGYTHGGIDLAAAKNTPVKAFADGVVKSAAFDAQSGNVVAIDHGNGYQTRYHHLNFMSVKPGQAVMAGDKIGGVGTTGWNSTGDHLHFAVNINGRYVDPAPYLQGINKLPKGTVTGTSKPQAGTPSDIDKFLHALRMQESGNNYGAFNPISNAGGAYQYIPSTWAGYGGYAVANIAPPAVQDQRARRDAMALWNKYGNWEQVAAHHLFPYAAGDRSQWHRIPWNPATGRPFPGNPTIAQYVAGVMGHMGRAGSTSSWEGSYLSSTSPSKAQIFQAIVQSKGLRKMEDVLEGGPLTNFLPRGRFSMGLASLYADKYDPGYADKSLGATEWFAHGAVVNGHTNAILGERGPEMVLPLNEKGAEYLANVMGKMQIEIPWADSATGGGQVITNNYYQTIDKGTHLHGQVTVVANDTSQMYQGLEREARRERLMSR